LIYPEAIAASNAARVGFVFALFHALCDAGSSGGVEEIRQRIQSR
jgi:hypothetical protein